MAASISAKNSYRVFRKTLTFAGGSGTGAVGTVAVATMTGSIFIEQCAGFVSTALVSTSNDGTIELGVTGATAGLIAQETADQLLAGMVWTGATQDEAVSAVTGKAVTGNIFITVATNAVLSGVMTITIYYRPGTVDGFLA